MPLPRFRSTDEALPHPLELQLRRRGVSLDQMVAQAQIDEAAVATWLRDGVAPPFEELCAIADVLRVFPEHLLKLPPSSRVLLRGETLGTGYSRVAAIIDSVDIERSMLTTLGVLPIIEPMRGMAVWDHRQASAVAGELRHALGVDLADPVADVIAVIEQAGVGVIVAPIEDAPEGIAFRYSDGSLGIFLNSAQRFGPRFRFSAAHELGHHSLDQLGQDGTVIDSEVSPEKTRSTAEKHANTFAASFLLPPESAQATSRVAELAETYGVSAAVAEYQVDNVKSGRIDVIRDLDVSTESGVSVVPEVPEMRLPWDLQAGYAAAQEARLIAPERVRTVAMMISDAAA